MAKKASQSAPPPRRPHPEKKIGPFAGGVGVAVWLNTAETEDGPRQFRSITIAPRRYQDRETGEWKDAGSFNPGDLPALIFALQKAQEFCFVAPLSGENSSDNGGQSASTPF